MFVFFFSTILYYKAEPQKYDLAAIFITFYDIFVWGFVLAEKDKLDWIWLWVNFDYSLVAVG